MLNLSTPNIVVIAILLGFSIQSSKAALVFELSQQGPRITMTLSGTLDLNSTLGFGGVAVNPFVWLSPNSGSLGIAGNAASNYYTISAAGWAPYGSGGYRDWSRVSGVTSSGDRVALFGGPVIGVPTNYISGAELSAVASFPGDYSFWGLAPGTYTTAFSSGAISDSVTVKVNPIPEPSTFVLFVTTLLSFTRRHRLASRVAWGRSLNLEKCGSEPNLLEQ